MTNLIQGLSLLSEALKFEDKQQFNDALHKYQSAVQQFHSTIKSKEITGPDSKQDVELLIQYYTDRVTKLEKHLDIIKNQELALKEQQGVTLKEQQGVTLKEQYENEDHLNKQQNKEDDQAKDKREKEETGLTEHLEKEPNELNEQLQIENGEIESCYQPKKENESRKHLEKKGEPNSKQLKKEDEPNEQLKWEDDLNEEPKKKNEAIEHLEKNGEPSKQSNKENETTEQLKQEDKPNEQLKREDKPNEQLKNEGELNEELKKEDESKEHLEKQGEPIEQSKKEDKTNEQPKMEDKSNEQLENEGEPIEQSKKEDETTEQLKKEDKPNDQLKKEGELNEEPKKEDESNEHLEKQGDPIEQSKKEDATTEQPKQENEISEKLKTEESTEQPKKEDKYIRELLKASEKRLEDAFKLIRKLSESSLKGSSYLHDDPIVKRIELTIMCEKSIVNFSHVCGLKKEKKVLEQAVILPIKFPEIFSNGLSPYKGFLFFGPPGTGKTFIAKAVAGEASSTTFFAVSAADLISKWQGESESLVKNLFQVARQKKPSIIFFDEIDSLALSRSSSTSDNESSRRIKSELFVQMEGVNTENNGVFVMAATNTPQNLDDAILRRFDKLIYVPLPDAQARSEMFQQFLVRDNNCDLQPEDLEKLAKITEGLSGSDIAVVCKKVKMQCIERLQNSSHFRAVLESSSSKISYTPCSATDEDAIRMTLRDVPAGCLSFKPLTSKEDAMKCAGEAKPRIDLAQIRELEQFATEKGEWSNHPAVSLPSTMYI